MLKKCLSIGNIVFVLLETGRTKNGSLSGRAFWFVQQRKTYHTLIKSANSVLKFSARAVGGGLTTISV